MVQILCLFRQNFLFLNTQKPEEGFKLLSKFEIFFREKDILQN